MSLLLSFLCLYLYLFFFFFLFLFFSLFFFSFPFSFFFSLLQFSSSPSSDPYLDNGIEELDIAIEEQDVETSPALMSLTSTLISKLEKMVAEVLDVVIKGWEVKVTTAEVKQLKSDFAKLVREVIAKSSELEEVVVVGGYEEKTKLELILYSRDVLGVTAVASLLLPYVTSDPNLVQDPPVSNQKVSMETLEERLRSYEKTTERINDTPRLLDMGSKFPRSSMLLDLENKSKKTFFDFLFLFLFLTLLFFFSFF